MIDLLDNSSYFLFRESISILLYAFDRRPICGCLSMHTSVVYQLRILVAQMMKRSPPKKLEQPRKIQQKQMERTLSQLHKLQLQVYELDSPTKIPYRGSPVKKQLKQLANLHQNMLRPKKKNTLNISKQTIKQVFQTLAGQPVDKVPTSTLRKYFTQIFATDYDFQLITNNRSDLTVDQLYEFLNYSEYDNFNVEKQVFAMLDKQGRGVVDHQQLDRLMEMFGYNSISRQMLHKVLDTQGTELTFDKFKSIMHKIQPGLN